MVLSMSLFVAACTSGDSTRSIPSIDAPTSAEIEARAFMRACRDVICAGAPIFAPDSTSDSVRQAIIQFTDEVEYLSRSQVEEMYSSEGRFEDGATLIGVGRVVGTEREDVRGVNVSVSRGFNDSVRRTYLFLWDGKEWVDTSPDAVDVTVTSSVS